MNQWASAEIVNLEIRAYSKVLFNQKKIKQLSLQHTRDPSAWEVEARVQIRGRPGKQREPPSLKKKKKEIKAIYI